MRDYEYEVVNYVRHASSRFVCIYISIIEFTPHLQYEEVRVLVLNSISTEVGLS